MTNGALLAWSALAVLGLASGEAAAATNVALSRDGATVVYTSSATRLGDNAIMTGDLLQEKKAPWYFNGDTRYTFGANDPNGTIEIKLGKIEDIVTIGAKVALHGHDRPVLGPVAFQVSLDGASWTDWGGPITITRQTVNPLSITKAPEAVRYIKYTFGPTSKYFGAGGAAVGRIFADAITAAAVPEPSTWAVMTLGFGVLGAALRRRTRARILRAQQV